MKLRCLKAAALAAAFFMGSGAALAQGYRPGMPSAVPTLTREVHMALKHERALLDALKAGDAAPIEALLGDDFYMVVAQDPGVVVLRDDWLDSIRKRGDAGAYTVKGMSAREVGGQLIASFVLQPQAKGRQPVFVVDVWQPQPEDRAKLLYRFAALTQGPREAIPGDFKQATLPKKY